MASLTQLLARHDSILILDAASARIQVGLVGSLGECSWQVSTEESGKALFILTEACLREAGTKLEDVDAFAFCEGPGSMLGIRTAAMAIRTWQATSRDSRPAYRYQSLPLVAREILRGGKATFTVIADARRESWHAVEVTGSAIQPLRRIAQTDLAARSEPLFSPAGFRAWNQPPRPATEVGYDVASLLKTHRDAPLFEEASNPDAFQHEAPEYKKWSAQIHTRP